MSEGQSRQEAEKYCREAQNVNIDASLVFRDVKVSRDSEVGAEPTETKSHEPTGFERCIAGVMAVRNIDKAEAVTLCTELFNDPIFKQAAEAGDAWQMGKCLHEYSMEHDAKWQHYRERRTAEVQWREKQIGDIIREIQSDVNDPDRFLPSSSLREKAEHIYEIRQGRSEAQKRKEQGNSRSTVGDLYGKTREQIIAEDHRAKTDDRMTVGDLYGKSREQRIKEDSAREDFKEFERKAKERGAVMPSNPEYTPSGKPTVGNLYGKTRKQILDMNKKEGEA